MTLTTDYRPINETNISAGDIDESGR